MNDRREFSVGAQVEILRRATDPDGRTHCEKCGAWCKRRSDYEVDHLISEGLRSSADRKRKLKAVDGQLLCIACHKAKTADDKGVQGEAKRREAAALGARPPGRQKIKQKPKDPKRETKRARGVPALMRRGWVAAGDK